MSINQKLKQIQLAIFDLDGVFTDGSIYYSEQGEEQKSFNVKDGLGIRLLLDNDIEVAVISGRQSGAAKHRLCSDLKISHYFEGCANKPIKIKELKEKTNIPYSKMIYVGDDLIDLSAMRLVGLSAAPNDAESVVKQQADILLTQLGGRGCVREICDQILIAKGLWEETISRFSLGTNYTN